MKLKKVKHLLKSLLFNEYGKIPFWKTKQQLLDNYDKAVVKISGKEFGELYREKKIQYYCERSKNAVKRT